MFAGEFLPFGAIFVSGMGVSYARIIKWGRISKSLRLIGLVTLVQWFLTGVRRSRFKGSVDVIRYFDIL